MSLITYDFDLLVTPIDYPPIIKLSQYDDSRTYVAHLKNDNGSAFQLASGATATFEGVNSKGVAFQIEATVDGDKVSFTPSGAATDQYGKINASICIKSGGEQLTTLIVRMEIQKAGATKEDIERSPGFTDVIDEAVDKYLDDHPPFFTLPSGGQSGQALLSDGNDGAYWGAAQSGGSGLTDEAKQALLACFANVAWINDDGQTYYDALYDALYPPQPELPDGYTQYDYIKSAKTTSLTLDARNTINLKVYPNIFAHNVEVEFGFETGVGQYTNLFFGGQNNPGGSAPPNNAFAFSVNSGGLSMHANGVYTNYQQNIPNVPKKKNIARYFGSIASPSSYQANDETPYSIAWASGGETLETQLSVCGIRNYYNVTATLVPYVLCGKIKVMSLSGELQENYVPCVRDADNVIGLYETVGGVFYTTSQPAWATIGNASCYYAVGNWEA